MYTLCLLLFDYSLQIVIKSSLDRLTDPSILICPQHDAACRVIARLKKERDEAWSSLAQSERQIMLAASIAITSYATLSSGKNVLYPYSFRFTFVSVSLIFTFYLFIISFDILAPKDVDLALLDRKYMLELLLPLLLS